MTGNVRSDKDLDEMLQQAPGQLNFTVFLSMMGDKIKGDTGTRHSARSHFHCLPEISQNKPKSP